MECRQAVLLSRCLPPATPIISPQPAAGAQHLMCFLRVLSHVLFGIVISVILNESDQTQRCISLWDFQYYVREFSIIINPNTFECHVSDMPDLFDAPLFLREKKWASDRGRSYCFIDHSKNTLTLGDMLRKLHASLVHSAPTVVHKNCVFVHCVSPHHKWS